MGTSAPRPRGDFGLKWPIAPLLVLGALAVLALRAFWPGEIILTQANDLGNHVRHVYEYMLALREGQFPPLTAPSLNGNLRIPLFQYYTGTAYMLPGALALAMNPYLALRISSAVHLLLGAIGVLGVCRTTGTGRFAALATAMLFMLTPFAGVDLIDRGAYPEFIALEASPILLWLMLRIGNAKSALEQWKWAMLALLGWGYFIPLHPVQALLCGFTILLLGLVYAAFDQRMPRRLMPILVAFFGGAALSAWFWWPIARDYGRLRVVPWGAFYNAFKDNHGPAWAILFWPWRRVASETAWAPQIGVIAPLATVATILFWRRASALARTAALLVIAVTLLILFGDRSRWVVEMLKPIQWSYRLILPALLATTVSSAFVLQNVGTRFRRGRMIITAAVVMFVAAVHFPYFKPTTPSTRVKEADVLSEDFRAPNSTFYAMRGTDYGSLHWADAKGRLRTHTIFPITHDGLPVEIRLRCASIPAASQLSVVIRPSNAPVRTIGGGDGLFEFRLSPRVGRAQGDDAINFSSNPANAEWMLLDAMFHVEGDPPDLWFRAAHAKALGGGEYAIQAPAAGNYQIPVCITPSSRVMIGPKTIAQRSLDGYFAIVPLQAGMNEVVVQTRVDALAGLVSLGAGLGGLVGIVVCVAIERRRELASR